MVGWPQPGFSAVAQFISDDLCRDLYSVLGPVGAVVAHEYIVNALKQIDVFVPEVVRMWAGEPFRITIFPASIEGPDIREPLRGNKLIGRIAWRSRVEITRQNNRQVLVSQHGYQFLGLRQLDLLT